MSWESELYGNTDQAWTSFKRILFPLIDRHIPKIKISSTSQPMWYDAETHNLCREKDRLHKKWRDTDPNDIDLKKQRGLKFSDSRRKFKNLVKRKMKDNFEDDDDTNLITKKFWSYVKVNSKSYRIPELIHLGNVFRTEPLQQAELFNEHFFSQFSEVSHYDTPVDVRNFLQLDIDFSPLRILDILNNLNVNKAVGPDKIHGRLLKNCSNVLSRPLSILFRKCYKSSIIPSEWKMALVVPVHKKGPKADVENYRPISLISLVMKVMEKLVRDELMLRCNDIIDSRQHGFVPGKSCCTQLIGFCDSLALSLNSRIRSDVIYFDFAKAFDSVNHDIIITKLKSLYNINGLLLRFIKNYLHGRMQSVVLGNCSSRTLAVLSGVPQGSILGPSLFVLFLNDITLGLNPGTNIVMYADDTKLWREITCENDNVILQSDIDYLMDWAIRNKMRFHPSKCKVLMVSSFNPPFWDLPFGQHHYSMGEDFLDYADSEKDLGILINGTLNFNEHASMLYSKANQKFGLLKRTCHFVDSTSRKRVLYLTMVRSLFEHCPVVWRPASVSIIDKLEGLQKRALKWILNDYSVSYSNGPLYYIHCKQLNILPIKFRFDYHDLKIFHEIVNGFSCVTLPSYIESFRGNRLRASHMDGKCYVSTVMPRNLQNNHSGSVKGFSNSYFYRAHLLWNRLPLSVREIIRPSLYKEKILEFIWVEMVGSCDVFESDNEIDFVDPRA